MQHRTFTSLLSATLLLLISTTLIACDSNDDEPSEAVADISAMFTRMQGALSIAFTPFGTKNGEPQIIVDCPQGGTVDVQGSAPSTGQNSFSFNYSMDFDDCNDLDGTISYEGSGSFASDFTQFSYSGSMSGTMEAECTLQYNSYSQDINANLQSGQTSLTLNGAFNATCGSNQLTCSFNNKAFDVNSDAASFFIDQCN
jgi:hypothetical protein